MFDKKEKIILKELIKNPRVSDNQIAKNTDIPVMTVNRKRKKLEEEEKLLYLTYVNNKKSSTSSQLYILKFKSGITKALYLNKIKNDNHFKSTYSNYVEYSFLGEKDGHLSLIMVITGFNDSELVEIFNGLIVKSIKSNFGEDAIDEIITTRLSMPLRLHYNYIPSMNVEKGVLKKSWSDDNIFVEREQEKEDSQKFLSNF